MITSKSETKIQEKPSKTGKKNAKTLLIGSLAFLAVVTSVLGSYSIVKTPTVYGANDRDRLQLKLEQLKSQINSYQQQISQTRNQSASLQNEISIYDNQIKSLELQIEANQTQREDTTLQINELEIQIQRRQEEIDENKKILSSLILQLAKLDNSSFLQIGLGTDDFSSFLDQVQYVRSVQDQVYSLVSRIKEIKVKLETQQKDLKESLAKLESLKDELAISQDTLESQRGAKEQLLAQTKGAEKNYQALLGQTKNEEYKILEELSDLDSAAQSKGGKKSISVSKGVLAWPMDGVLTQGYGNTGFRSLGYNSHNGIDIAAPAGKPIYAAADGTVAKCDTGEAAYGNWCTIKHNIETKSGARCIVTLYAHMRSIKVKTGSKVEKGDLVGYEGNTGNTTRLLYGPERGYHLHFSVFDCDGYTVTPGKYSDVYGAYSVPSGYTYNPMTFLGQ
ncbi:peptidoglycan DD-metalloendopeptidase family protein [bacterium]|nr:MAG: peptidoglycan DD-metalloendopeptidase family protein [bacterium]